MSEKRHGPMGAMHKFAQLALTADTKRISDRT